MFETMRFKNLIRKAGKSLEESRKRAKKTKYIEIIGPSMVPHKFDLRNYADSDEFVDNMFNAAQEVLKAMTVSAMGNKEIFNKLIALTPGQLSIVALDFLMTQVNTTLKGKTKIDSGLAVV